MRRHGVPETITIDGSGANAAAVEGYNAEHVSVMARHQVKCLHNIVEQDHRTVKRLTRAEVHVQVVLAAQHPLAAIDLMHMIWRGQLVREAWRQGLTPAEPFYSLAAS